MKSHILEEAAECPLCAAPISIAVETWGEPVGDRFNVAIKPGRLTGCPHVETDLPCAEAAA